MIKLLGISQITLASLQAQTTVVISEFLAINPNGEDWIELYNPTASTISLGGYSLTDDSENAKKFVIPSGIILPGDHLLIESTSLGFSLSGSGEYLALLDENETILSEFPPSYPSQFPGVSYGLRSDGTYDFLGTPTPAEANSVTPYFTNYASQFLPDGSVNISVSATSSATSLSKVSLHYRSMFTTEITIAMTPQGGDSYLGTIPSNAASAGEMLRWRLTAEAATNTTKLPPFSSSTASPEYFGTVIPDPNLSTQLPVFQWFLPPSSYTSADTRTGTRCSIFWNGEFYDNILVHLRGATTATLEKKPHQFEFNPGHNFRITPDTPRVDQININAAYSDSSYLRDILPMENLHTMGLPSPETFPVRVQRNGEFHSLGIMVEQLDNEFLTRHDDILAPNGSLYKATGNGSWLASANGFEARNDSFLSDLSSFTSSLSGANQLDFLLENTDLPSLVNYLSTNVVDSIFNPQKNYYVHQNRFGEWMILPWDRDFSYGHRWLGGADPRGPAGPTNFLVTDERYEWGGSNNDSKAGYNRLFNAIFVNPTTSEMFYRRLRSAMDTILAPGVLEARIEELRILMKQEADLDRAVWNYTNETNYRNFRKEPFDNALDRIKADYLPDRRTFLENDGGTPSRGTLPASQPSQPSITFGKIITNPTSGDQDDESLELQNPNEFAVDLSNWTLSGAISHTLRPGTVIPANSSLFISPNIQQFRTNNDPVFSQGNFSGHFSNFSETLDLHSAAGDLIATVTTPDLPSNNQLHLVISEIMYHPADDLSEFIELHNTSDTLTLDLSGVAFTSGITYTFPSETTLLPGQRIVINTFTTGRLRNEGETLKLEDADGSTISEFAYNNSAPWPTLADGQGRSLIYRSGDPESPQNWRTSLADGGNPGASDSIPFTGNDLLIYALTAPVSIDLSTKTLTAPRRAGADAVELIPQWTTDFTNWQDTDFTLISSEPLTWTLPNHVGRKSFYRIKLLSP